MSENQASLGELVKTLNLVRNKQIEIFDRLHTLDERVQDALNRFRPLEDRIVRLENAAEVRGPGYSR